MAEKQLHTPSSTTSSLSKNREVLSSIDTKTEKQSGRNQELKFKMELELFKGGINDEIFLSNYLKSFYDVNLNSFDAETRKKFIEEMKIVFEELRGFDAGMINGLRLVRESMSMGLEVGKDDNYYRSMIIGKKIQSRITVLQESIKTIRGKTIKIGGTQYNEIDYNDLKDAIVKLDQTNGLNIFAKLESKPIATNYGELSGLFYQELSRKIANPQLTGSLSYKKVLEGLASIGSNGKAEKLTNVRLTDGKTVNLFELYGEYNKNYRAFKTRNEVFRIGNKQLKTTTQGFGFNEQYHGLGYDKLEEAYEDKLMDVEKMGYIDIVIMLRVLFSVIPVAGDMVGGIDDIKQANAGVNFDGSIQGAGENMLGYLVGMLGITIVGGTFGKIAKGPKYAKVIMRLGQVIDKLSRDENLVRLASDPKIMSMLESMKLFVPKIGELLKKISIRTQKRQITSRNSQNKSDVSSHRIDNPSSLVHSRVEGQKLFIQDIHGYSELEIRREFSRIIVDKNIRTIHFNPHLDSAKKRILSNILAKNYPLIEVLRLIPGNDIVNVGFAGIKKLNDTYGQDFVDSLMEVSKAKIMQGAEGYARAHEHADHMRLVRDDYKNLSISVPSGIPVGQALFGGMTSKQQFIDGVIHDMHDTIGAQAHEKGISVADIEADIRKYFNFGVGEASVGEKAGGKDKLLSFAGAEGVARDGLASSEITVHTFDKSRYETYAKAFLQCEEEIVRQWKGAKFTIDGVEDSVVFEIGGQKILNPELLRQIRKHGAVGAGIEPKALAEYIERYIDTLNKGFDFIVPARNLESDLKTAGDISQDFSQGLIRTQSFLETFKGVMTREHFMYMVGKCLGMRVFIDIKDMGVENLQSFRQLAKKVGSGTYSPDDLLTAGKEMTDKFTLFVERIKASYPDALISLGGDEIRVFFPGVGKQESDQILASIEKELQYTGLEGRSSHTLEVAHTLEDNEKIFKNLDISTVLHKTIEAALLRKRVLLKQYQKIRETISLELGSGVNEQNLAKLLKNPEFGKLLNRVIDTVVIGKSLPKDISLPGGGMLHFQREGGLLKFLFTHAS